MSLTNAILLAKFSSIIQVRNYHIVWYFTLSGIVSLKKIFSSIFTISYHENMCYSSNAFNTYDLILHYLLHLVSQPNYYKLGDKALIRVLVNIANHCEDVPHGKIVSSVRKGQKLGLCSVIFTSKCRFWQFNKMHEFNWHFDSTCDISSNLQIYRQHF